MPGTPSLQSSQFHKGRWLSVISVLQVRAVRLEFDWDPSSAGKWWDQEWACLFCLFELSSHTVSDHRLPVYLLPPSQASGVPVPSTLHGSHMLHLLCLLVCISLALTHWHIPYSLLWLTFLVPLPVVGDTLPDWSRTFTQGIHNFANEAKSHGSCPRSMNSKGFSLYQNSSVRMLQRLSLIRKKMVAMYIPKWKPHFSPGKILLIPYG